MYYSMFILALLNMCECVWCAAAEEEWNVVVGKFEDYVGQDKKCGEICGVINAGKLHHKQNVGMWGNTLGEWRGAIKSLWWWQKYNNFY